MLKKSLYLFDSTKKEKVKFESMEQNKAKIYVCGPTVYDDAHLGHARSAIVFDLLHRILKANNYEVIMVKNFTDIDDKIINKMEKTGNSLENITFKYMSNYKNEMNLLNILPNSIEPKATESIDSMKNLISELLNNNNAYELNDGIYFDIDKDLKYGSISIQNDLNKTISRIEKHKDKRNQKDFALWKFNTNGVSFQFQNKQGRPGWHSECSAMIKKHLSDEKLPFAIDIHGGGIDLLFPHHENEATQYRMAYNQELSKYWVHNGFVNINGEKMSKSLGNSFFLKDILNIYNPEVIRFYLLSLYYRQDLSFNFEDLELNKKRLDKLYRLKKRIYGVDYKEVKTSFQHNLLDVLNDDMNVSKANALIDEMISFYNDKLNQNEKDKKSKSELFSDLNYLSNIMGIGYQNPFLYFEFGIKTKELELIEKLIKERNYYKSIKDFKKSDEIRIQLKNMNINIMDTNKGVIWEKIK